MRAELSGLQAGGPPPAKIIAVFVQSGRLSGEKTTNYTEIEIECSLNTAEDSASQIYLVNLPRLS